MKRYILAAAIIIGAPAIVGLANNLPTQSCFLNITDQTILRSARKYDSAAHFTCNNGVKTLISRDASNETEQVSDNVNNEPELIDAIDYQILAKETDGQCASPGANYGCRYDSNITIPAPQ
jgi:hypothetical protein